MINRYKFKNNITFECDNHTLNEVIDFFKKENIALEEVKFELDFGSCYYDGDYPDIIALAPKIKK